MAIREPRVTARAATPRIAMGNGDAPDTINGRRTIVPRVTTSTHNMPHTVVLYRHDHELAGFVRDVRSGDDRGRNGASRPTTAPNMDDMRHPDARDGIGYVVTASATPQHNADGTYRPARRVVTNTVTGMRAIVDDNVNGGTTSPRRVRTVDMGDAPLPGIRGAVTRDGAKPSRSTTPRNPRAARPSSDRLADVREFAAAHGIPLEKLADRRVVAAIRDVIAHRASVAAYAAR